MRPARPLLLRRHRAGTRRPGTARRGPPRRGTPSVDPVPTPARVFPAWTHEMLETWTAERKGRADPRSTARSGKAGRRRACCGYRRFGPLDAEAMASNLEEMFSFE